MTNCEVPPVIRVLRSGLLSVEYSITVSGPYVKDYLAESPRSFGLRIDRKTCIFEETHTRFGTQPKEESMIGVRGAFRFLLLTGVIGIMIGCGSDGPTKSSGREAKGGRVYLRNESVHEISIEVTLKYGDESRTLTVGAGETAEISEEPIEGGTSIQLMMRPSNPRVPFTFDYEIDGDITIVATSVLRDDGEYAMNFDRVMF